jgi:hypothetical protein
MNNRNRGGGSRPNRHECDVISPVASKIAGRRDIDQGTAAILTDCAKVDRSGESTPAAHDGPPYESGSGAFVHDGGRVSPPQICEEDQLNG